MRLLKLILLGGIGYLVYQWLSNLSQRRLTGEEQPAGTGDLGEALNRDPGRMRITGLGQGMSVAVEDPDGAAATEIVGRGVVRR